MDKRTLVEKDYKEGAMLVNELDKAGFPVHAALWLYNPEKDSWRLILASKAYDNTGPLKAYQHINEVLTELTIQNAGYDIALDNISFLRTSNKLLKLLSTTIQTDSGITDAGIRFSGRAINNQYIEDAYIYRVG